MSYSEPDVKMSFDPEINPAGLEQVAKDDGVQDSLDPFAMSSSNRDSLNSEEFEKVDVNHIPVINPQSFSSDFQIDDHPEFVVKNPNLIDGELDLVNTEVPAFNNQIKSTESTHGFPKSNEPSNIYGKAADSVDYLMADNIHIFDKPLVSLDDDNDVRVPDNIQLESGLEQFSSDDQYGETMLRTSHQPGNLSPREASPSPYEATPPSMEPSLQPGKFHGDTQEISFSPIVKDLSPISKESSSFLESGPISRESSPSPIPREPTPVRMEPSPIQQEPSPIPREASPIQREPSPISREASPIQREPSPIQREPSPIQREPSPIQREPSPIQREPSPVSRESTPESRDGSQVSIESSPAPPLHSQLVASQMINTDVPITFKMESQEATFKMESQEPTFKMESKEPTFKMESKEPTFKMESKEPTFKMESKEPTFKSNENGGSFCSSDMKNSDMLQVVVNLIYWRDVKKSGAVFGAVMLILLSMAYFSLISVVAYTSLTVLTGTISFRTYKNIMQAIQKSQDGHPFKDYLEMDTNLHSDKMHEMTEVFVSQVNSAVSELKRLFLVEDLIDSVKFGCLLWCLTYLGSWFNGLTLVILAVVALFSLPKVYEQNQAQIDQYLGLVKSHVNDVMTKVRAAIPIGNKEKAQ